MPTISRTNLSTNPSAETSTTGTTTIGSGPPALSQVGFAWPGAGTKAYRLVWVTSTNPFNGITQTFSTVSGTVYTCSAWVYVPSGSPAVAAVVAGAGFGTTSAAFDTWTRIYITFTATASSHAFQVVAIGNQTAGQLATVDALLCEATNSLLAYFDGDTAGASWNGTAELSTSTLAAFDPGAGLPALVVEFDATAPQATDFILDSSLLNGGAVLVGSPRFVSVSSGIESVSIMRGASDPNSPVQAAQVTLDMDNASGAFDPDNLNSPYNQQPGNPQLVKGMLVRISALFASGGVFTAQQLFYGRLDVPDIDVGIMPTASFACVDDIAALGQVSVPSFNNSVNAGDGTTGGRCRWALAQVPNLTGTPVISTGMARDILPTYGGDSVLDELNTAATCEAGMVFVDRFGAVNATAHGDEYTKTPIAILSDGGSIPNGIEYEAITVSNGIMQIVNGAIVQRYNSPSTYATMTGGDAASASKYGAQTITVTAPLTNDTDAQALASYLGTAHSRPISLVTSVTVNFTGQGNAAVLLSAEIGQQITVSRTIPYLNAPRTLNLRLVIIGLQWTVDGQGTFKLTIYTGPVDITSLYGSAGAFILDSSLLDGGDVLTPY